MKATAWSIVAVSLLVAAVWTGGRFRQDIGRASALSATGSEVVNTRCGPIEVQQAGQGTPLLVVHGSGGGHDQGMAWARPLTQHGVRVIAVSRFGYLRTPRPVDASPEAQADAHVCLLDALGIQRAAVMGVSAGGPSAMQTAIRHPDRVRCARDRGFATGGAALLPGHDDRRRAVAHADAHLRRTRADGVGACRCARAHRGRQDRHAAMGRPQVEPPAARRHARPPVG